MNTEDLTGRPCYKCGVTTAILRGKALCDGCRVFPGLRKQRDCVDCSTTFRTTNNGTRCSACKYSRNLSRSNKRCVDCDTQIDPRSKRCVRCASQPGVKVVRNARGPEHDIGTRYVHPTAGYVDIKTETGWRREHTVVMEQHLGRSLVKGENVHHMNGVRDDNRIENLELWAKPQQSGVRARDLLKWAREIVDRYEGEDI